MKKLSGLLLLFMMSFSGTVSAGGINIIGEWNSVKTPPAPVPDAVRIDPSSTALLVLDIEQRTVPSKPRALAALPGIEKLIAWARAHGVPVAYSITKLSTPEAILPEVKPRDDEIVVKAGVDKFFGTDLEKHLRENKITTVIITGTAAEGAVLGTMIGSVLRGFKVILPADGIPSSSPYAEQYVVWHALNAPGTKGNVTVTEINLISAR